MHFHFKLSILTTLILTADAKDNGRGPPSSQNVASASMEESGDGTSKSSTSLLPQVTSSPFSADSLCTQSCVNAAATQSGCDITNINCLCDSSNFQSDALNCLQELCSNSEGQNSLNQLQNQCNSGKNGGKGKNIDTDPMQSSSSLSTTLTNTSSITPLASSQIVSTTGSPSATISATAAGLLNSTTFSSAETRTSCRYTGCLKIVMLVAGMVITGTHLH